MVLSNDIIRWSGWMWYSGTLEASSSSSSPSSSFVLAFTNIVSLCNTRAQEFISIKAFPRHPTRRHTRHKENIIKNISNLWKYYIYTSIFYRIYRLIAISSSDLISSILTVSMHVFMYIQIVYTRQIFIIDYIQNAEAQYFYSKEWCNCYTA